MKSKFTQKKYFGSVWRGGGGDIGMAVSVTHISPCKEYVELCLAGSLSVMPVLSPVIHPHICHSMKHGYVVLDGKDST